MGTARRRRVHLAGLGSSATISGAIGSAPYQVTEEGVRPSRVTVGAPAVLPLATEPP